LLSIAAVGSELSLEGRLSGSERGDHEEYLLGNVLRSAKGFMDGVRQLLVSLACDQTSPCPSRYTGHDQNHRT
jgi:hypothetical protein